MSDEEMRYSQRRMAAIKAQQRADDMGADDYGPDEEEDERIKLHLQPRIQELDQREAALKAAIAQADAALDPPPLVGPRPTVKSLAQAYVQLENMVKALQMQVEVLQAAKGRNDKAIKSLYAKANYYEAQYSKVFNWMRNVDPDVVRDFLAQVRADSEEIHAMYRRLFQRMMIMEELRHCYRRVDAPYDVGKAWDAVMCQTDAWFDRAQHMALRDLAQMFPLTNAEVG